MRKSYFHNIYLEDSVIYFLDKNIFWLFLKHSFFQNYKEIKNLYYILKKINPFKDSDTFLLFGFAKGLEPNVYKGKVLISKYPSRRFCLSTF